MKLQSNESRDPIDQVLDEVLDELLIWPPEHLNPISRQIAEEERLRRQQAKEEAAKRTFTIEELREGIVTINRVVEKSIKRLRAKQDKLIAELQSRCDHAIVLSHTAGFERGCAVCGILGCSGSGDPKKLEAFRQLRSKSTVDVSEELFRRFINPVHPQPLEGSALFKILARS